MGIYRPVVEQFQRGGGAHKPPTSKKIVSPATMLTVARPIIGGRVMYDLIKGNPGVTKKTIIGAATDMEGVPARGIDKFVSFLTKQGVAVPEWLQGRGATEAGQQLDPPADTAFAAEVTTGVIFGKNTSPSAKLAAMIIAAKEGRKTAWYASKSKAYGDALSERGLEREKLIVPVSKAGKEGMTEALVGMVLAVTTSDLKDKKVPALRTIAGILAVGHAVVAFARGELVTRHYDTEATAMIAELKDGIIDGQEEFPFTEMPNTPVFSLGKKLNNATPDTIEA
ncbi:MAG: hypothetical protein WAQ24_00315 [Candidatus Saccharimonadales bacterium]